MNPLNHQVASNGFNVKPFGEQRTTATDGFTGFGMRKIQISFFFPFFLYLWYKSNYCIAFFRDFFFKDILAVNKANSLFDVGKMFSKSKTGPLGSNLSAVIENSIEGIAKSIDSRKSSTREPATSQSKSDNAKSALLLDTSLESSSSSDSTTNISGILLLHIWLWLFFYINILAQAGFMLSVRTSHPINLCIFMLLLVVFLLIKCHFWLFLTFSPQNMCVN